ncbi:hypothetical protein WDU99_09025 [Microbacterium sp. Mu-80]|uniref:Alkylmercury lyase n=1 Tax=Microbacterium bandirmense TaxID=3122050 RepID=A0ABU8LBS8_9MICO
MSELTTQLPERLNNTEETGLDAVLLIPLLRLIVEGGPVTVEQFAAAAGRPVDDVRTGLAAVPDTEYDDQGRIIGQGLTLRPTPHRFTVAGEHPPRDPLGRRPPACRLPGSDRLRKHRRHTSRRCGHASGGY